MGTSWDHMIREVLAQVSDASVAKLPAVGARSVLNKCLRFISNNTRLIFCIYSGGAGR
jgi:hypothetical protein